MSSLQALPTVKVVARVQSSWDGRGIVYKRQNFSFPQTNFKDYQKNVKNTVLSVILYLSVAQNHPKVAESSNFHISMSTSVSLI